MNPLFYAFSAHIGAYTQKKPVAIDKSWWENDGLVSVVTADGPHVGSNDEIIAYNGTPQKGKWNYLGKMKKVDHMSIACLLYTSNNSFGLLKADLITLTIAPTTAYYGIAYCCKTILI